MHFTNGRLTELISRRNGMEISSMLDKITRLANRKQDKQCWLAVTHCRLESSVWLTWPFARLVSYVE